MKTRSLGVSAASETAPLCGPSLGSMSWKPWRGAQGRKTNRAVPASKHKPIQACGTRAPPPPPEPTAPKARGRGVRCVQQCAAAATAAVHACQKRSGVIVPDQSEDNSGRFMVFSDVTLNPIKPLTPLQEPPTLFSLCNRAVLSSRLLQALARFTANPDFMRSSAISLGFRGSQTHQASRNLGSWRGGGGLDGWVGWLEVAR